jgi:3-(3-hydroxy-phenyl)propionate hydroxylase
VSARVIVVGGGPVGLTTALLLARQGVRVLLIERDGSAPHCQHGLAPHCQHGLAPHCQHAASPRLPRTVSLDDESLRIWQACGLEERILDDWEGGEQGAVMCRYLTPDGRTFLRLRQAESDFGYPQAVVVHEGRITDVLAAAAARDGRITLRSGCTVLALQQDADRVRVTVRDAGDALSTESADWLVACDGARSTVRGLLGIAMHGTTLEHPWLVANLADTEPVRHASIRCDPRRSSVMVSIPHGVRRIECMLQPREEERIGRSDEEVRAILASIWSEAATAPILSASVVRFESRMAERWRLGRVFLAGDAAHLSPPFAAQGLAAGLRDAANIACKLGGVLQGWLAPEDLASYEAERRPHQERLSRLALRLGRIMAPRSIPEAVAVQGAVRMLTALPFADRLLHMRGRAIRAHYRVGYIGSGPAAGAFLPQPEIVLPHGGIRRLDDLLGSRLAWIVIGAGDRPAAAFTAARAAASAADTPRLVENIDFRDPSRTLQRTLGRCSRVLVRPDRIIHTHVPAAGRLPYLFGRTA